MSSSKCEICRYEDIGNIMLFDIVVHSCSKCGYLRMSTKTYDELLYNVLYTYNIGNIKLYSNTEDIDKRSRKIILKYNDFSKVGSFNVSDLNAGICNVCHSELAELKNIYFPEFSFLYCTYCDSMFFRKDDFMKFVGFLRKKCRPFNFIEFLKEIFHRIMKDNAKK